MQNLYVNYLSWATTAVAVGYVIYLSMKTSSAQKSGKINETVDLDNSKVVHNFEVEELDKKAVFCRCWKSTKFPYCDGSHNKHNIFNGDNVGPLIIQKK